MVSRRPAGEPFIAVPAFAVPDGGGTARRPGARRRPGGRERGLQPRVLRHPPIRRRSRAESPGGGVPRRGRPARGATSREGGVRPRAVPGRERLDDRVRDSLPGVPGPEGPRLRRRGPRRTRRFPGISAGWRAEEDAEQILGAGVERTRGVRPGRTPRAGGGSRGGPEDAPPRARGRRERSDVLQRPGGAPARSSAGSSPEDRGRRPLSRGPRGPNPRAPSEAPPPCRFLREDRRTTAAAQPPRDGVPVEGRARRGAERGHGSPDPTCAARQGGAGDPTRLRTSPASARGSHEPRRHLDDRLQVRPPPPRLRGLPSDAPRKVSRARRPKGPPRRVAGNQPGGPARSRGEEADPLRRSRGWRALREAGARETIGARTDSRGIYL